MNDTELIVLVDETGTPIGTAPKLASHHDATPLHRAFSCYIFNEKGELLVTKRAPTKKVWPDIWSNSVCGHPGPGESFVVALQRRTRYELGVEVSEVRSILRDYQYKTPPYNGIIEHEVCPVYFARTSMEPVLHPEEVAEYRWMTWQDYKEALQTYPEAWSYWAKDQFPLLQEANGIKVFMSV